MLLSAKNTLVLFTLDCEAYAGIVGLILIKLVVLAGQDSVQDNTGQRIIPASAPTASPDRLMVISPMWNAIAPAAL